MRRSRWISLLVQRVLITVAVFLAAMLVIYFTAINPKEIFSPCDRPCKRADWPRICRYRLVIEKRLMPKSLLAVDHKNIIRTTDQAAATTTGGHLAWQHQQQRHYFLVNGRHTGPALTVCERDFIVIDIVNRIPGQSIAIHWTGQSQRRTPFMDGVPMITQCPIASYTTFQYKFQADQVGTHLYHGFSAEERGLGLVGAFVVRSEHEQRIHPVTSGCHRQELVWIIAETDSGALSINGRRSFVQQVKPGLRYRLRVAFVSPFETLPEGCQYWLEVDQHRLTVIALDGNLLEPVAVERVALSDGDRIDLILETSLGKDAIGGDQEYEIRLVSVASNNGSCEQEHLRIASSSSRFKLKYVGTEAAGDQILMKEPDDGDGARAPAAAGSHPDWQEQKIPTKSDLDQQRPRGFNAGRLMCDVPSSVVAASPAGQISLNQICPLEDGEEVHRGTSWDQFPTELRDVDKTIRLVLTKRTVQREILGELFQDISYSVNGFSFVFPTAVMLRKLLPAIRRTGSRTGVADGQLHTCSGNGTGNTGGGRWMPKKCHQLPPDESCECVHVEHVEAGHRVELVLINEDPDSDHSYHLHGHSFYIVGAARFDEGWQHQQVSLAQFGFDPIKIPPAIGILIYLQLDQLLRRNFDRPLRRDTVRIERRSLVVLRFDATHAGLWLLRDLGAEHGWSRGLDVLLVVHGRAGRPAIEEEFDIPGDFPTCDNFVGPKYFLI
uniref:L-ascorbate oxidase n=1 Tax=Culex pipiens TaxID=7175 RepID=A0A8D8HID2_CULPI